MIDIINVTKEYKVGAKDKVVALKNINLHVEKGEIVLLKGPSGSGKSTILALIAALTKPTTGEVIVDGKRVSKLADNFTSLFRRQNVGFIFQRYNLIPTLSAKENVIVPLIPSNPDPDNLDDRLKSLFSKFSLEGKMDVMVKNLSGGEQQRVAIARALVNNPSIIIADEPTANLDKKLSIEFIEILRSLKNGRNSIIIASHDPLFFNLDFIDKQIDIHNGEIIS